MTKQDYIAIAKVFRAEYLKIQDPDTDEAKPLVSGMDVFWRLCYRLEDIFSDDKERFNRDRFEVAIRTGKGI